MRLSRDLCSHHQFPIRDRHRFAIVLAVTTRQDRTVTLTVSRTCIGKVASYQQITSCWQWWFGKTGCSQVLHPSAGLTGTYRRDFTVPKEDRSRLLPFRERTARLCSDKKSSFSVEEIGTKVLWPLYTPWSNGGCSAPVIVLLGTTLTMNQIFLNESDTSSEIYLLRLLPPLASGGSWWTGKNGNWTILQYPQLA